MAAALQVAHSPWQGSHVLVEVFSNKFVATHAVGQEVDSKNLPTGHEEHCVSAAPVHVEQFP